MADDDSPQVDPLVAHAIATCDYPTYVVRDVMVNKGGISEVYYRLDRSEMPSPTEAEVKDLVTAVMAEYKDLPRDKPFTSSRKPATETSFFPRVGADQDESSPAPDTDPTKGADVDIEAVMETVTVLRVEAVIERWRTGTITNADVLNFLRENIDF